MRSLVLLLALGITTAARTEPKADFFVSPSGDDKWSGKLSAPTRDLSDDPFRTLAHARDAVRELRLKQKLDRPVRGGSIEAGRKRGHDVRSLVADSRFRDPDNGDFSFTDDSVVRNVGFVPFNVSKAGVRKNRD